MEHLQNLKIVITAAASGLGSEIATTLSKSGSQVYICDNNEAALENFSKKNPLIKCALADVSNEVQMKKFFSNVLQMQKSYMSKTVYLLFKAQSQLKF